LGAGCAETVTVELNFPSPDTFVRSENAIILAFAIDERDVDGCPEIINQILIDSRSTATEQSRSHPVCDFRNGGVTFSGVNGLALYVAVTRNDRDPLLAGCAARDLSKDRSSLLIYLSPTEQYRDTYDPGDPAFCRPEEKCGLGCP
jgi:hypothetical protein